MDRNMKQKKWNEMCYEQEKGAKSKQGNLKLAANFHRTLDLFVIYISVLYSF